MFPFPGMILSAKNKQIFLQKIKDTILERNEKMKLIIYLDRSTDDSINELLY